MMTNPSSGRMPLESQVAMYPGVSRGGSTWHFVWLCLLILSFCYELPLAFLTSYDRINPRLFDVVAILGIFTVLPGLHKPKRLPSAFRLWAYLIFWFALCSVVWTALWLSWDEGGKFSLFYVYRFMLGLLAIFMGACIPLDAKRKRIIAYCVVLGGIVVALYAIPEYLSGGWERKLTDEKVKFSPAGAVLSSLGPNYFHVGSFCPLASAMALALAGYTKRMTWRWPLFFVAVFVSWPALVCGSRAGLVAVGLVFAIAFFIVRGMRFRYISLGLIAVVLVLTGIVRPPSLETLSEMSVSFSRLIALEERGGADSIAGRTTTGEETYLGTDLTKVYAWQGWLLPVLGGGFYAVPQLQDGELVYRCGYGIHNIYIFAIEQGGIVAFLLFLKFLYVCVRDLVRIARMREVEDKTLAVGVGIFFAALMIIGWGGQVFWQGFGTENYNTYIVLMLVLATKPITSLTSIPSPTDGISGRVTRLPSPVS